MRAKIRPLMPIPGNPPRNFSFVSVYSSFLLRSQTSSRIHAVWFQQKPDGKNPLTAASEIPKMAYLSNASMSPPS